MTLALALAFIPAIPGVQAATEVTPSSGPVIEKVSMTIDGQLYVNFKVLAKDTDVSGYRVRMTIGEGANQFAYFAQDPVEEGSYWVYKAAMAAHRMPENVVIELLDSTGKAVQVKNWSIIEYLQKAGASDAANVPLNNLVDAMADYGSYAAYYAQASGALPNVGAVKPNIAAVENVTVSQLEGFKSTAKSTYQNLQPRAALELRENVDLQFSFNQAAFGSSTMKINGVPVTPTAEGDRMVYTIQDIRPTDWGRPYKVEITNGTNTFAMSYSVLSYARSMLNGSADANGFHGLMKAMYLYWAQARDYTPSIPGATVHIGDITGCRDPFILEENGVYYMYYTGGVKQGEKAYTNVRKSTDLIWWTQPIECFNSNNSPNFLDHFSLTEGGKVYVSARCMAPEVHKYTNPENGETAYYMFVTFSTKEPDADGGIATAILRSESPEGQFTLWSDGPVTPAAHGCIDGTLYIENGKPYVVYAHEWSCTNSTCLNSVLERGSFCYTELTSDLKAAKYPSAAPKKLFSPWSDSKVTDGPFVYTDANGASGQHKCYDWPCYPRHQCQRR